MKEKKYINKNPKDKRTYIEKTFEAFTAPQHLYGIDYLKHAIEVCCSNKEMMQGVTKTLYPYIAAKYFTNSAAVEHAIRTAITHIWQEKEEDISRLLFLKRGEKPTNKTFICAFSRYINEKTQNY